MKNKMFFTLLTLLFSATIIVAQENPLDKFNSLIGKWEGTGSGFNSSKSVIQSEFNRIMNNNFIEVKNHSEFEPTPQKPEGEIHEDWGVISFNKSREKIIFRQFHVEGFVIQYTLNDSLSNESTLIFESEYIENFVPGGTARFTINLKSDTDIETLFHVGFPGKEMSCFGSNRLKKQ